MKKLITPIVMPYWWADVLLAIPRIVGCYLLAAHFGWSKFPTPAWFIEDTAKLGLPFATFFAWAAVLTEVFGAALMVVGLCTRYAAFLLSCTMLVAIFLQKWNTELWEKLPAMGFLWLAIVYMVIGSGRFGLDYLIARKFKTQK